MKVLGLETTTFAGLSETKYDSFALIISYSRARLIEACGLKGHQIGGAQVSEKHANFIVTSPGATAEDIDRTITLMRDAVKEKFGIELQQEVRVIGEK